MSFNENLYILNEDNSNFALRNYISIPLKDDRPKEIGSPSDRPIKKVAAPGDTLTFSSCTYQWYVKLAWVIISVILITYTVFSVLDDLKDFRSPSDDLKDFRSPLVGIQLNISLLQNNSQVFTFYNFKQVALQLKWLFVGTFSAMLTTVTVFVLYCRPRRIAFFLYPLKNIIRKSRVCQSTFDVRVIKDKVRPTYRHFITASVYVMIASVAFFGVLFMIRTGW